MDLAHVRTAIALIPDRHAAQTARENLTLIEVVLQNPTRIRHAERKTIDPAKADGTVMTSRLDRETWVTGTDLLRRLLKNDLTIAKAIKESRYDDLHAAAVVAASGVCHSMAATDPAAYKAIRDAITLYHLKGYRRLDVAALKALADRRRQTSDEPV